MTRMRVIPPTRASSLVAIGVALMLLGCDKRGEAMKQEKVSRAKIGMKLDFAAVSTIHVEITEAVRKVELEKSMSSALLDALRNAEQTLSLGEEWLAEEVPYTAYPAMFIVLELKDGTSRRMGVDGYTLLYDPISQCKWRVEYVRELWKLRDEKLK